MKEFFDAIQRGEHRYDLFLAKGKYDRDQIILDLFREAGERNMVPSMNRSAMKITFEPDNVALIRIVHSELREQANGYQLTGVHGLESLSGLDRSHEIREFLLTRVRHVTEFP